MFASTCAVHRRRTNCFRAFALAAAMISTPVYASWRSVSPLLFPANTDTTLSLVFEQKAPAVQASTTTSLWFLNRSETQLLYPESTVAVNGSASIPVFARGSGSGELVIYDSASKTTSSIPWKSSATDEAGKRWVPGLTIHGEDGMPVVYANQQVTATLSMSPGSGPMPASAHIEATDHRGRVVLARHFSTFNLISGQETVQFPAAGQYDVTVQLIEDPLTSLPLAALRATAPIPYGETAAMVHEPEALPDGVTTDTVISMRVSLEETPATATLAAKDRMKVAVFGKHSLLIQKNRWPFGIAGADLLQMTIGEQKRRGAKLLHWQRRLGSSFAAMHLDWSKVQTGPNSYSWPVINSALKLHRGYMVRPILTISGKAAWNDSLPTETSATLEAWKNFTRELSERHEDLLWGLRCWDHPETTWPEPEPYIDLVDMTLQGFQMRDNERVPAPPVIVGNTSHLDVTYLESVLTSATEDRVSLGFDHFPTNPSQSPGKSGFEKNLEDAKKLLINNSHDSSKVWITGTGYANNPAGVSAELQANYLVRTFVIAASQDIYKVMWNSLIDRSEVPWIKNPELRMGLLDSDFMPKPAGIAYNIASYMMSGVTPKGISRQGKVKIYEFNIPLQNNKWAGALYVAWTESPDQVQDIRLEMTHGGGVYALDYLGAEVHARKVAEDSANSIVGSYQIPVGFEPVFIWDAGKPGQTD